MLGLCTGLVSISQKALVLLMRTSFLCLSYFTAAWLSVAAERPELNVYQRRSVVGEALLFTQIYRPILH